MPFTERGIVVGRSVALIGIVITGLAGIAALVALSIENANDATTIGQVIVFSGTIVAALVAYLKGAENVEQARLNAQRIDEVHAKVDSGQPTATSLSNGGNPTETTISQQLGVSSPALQRRRSTDK